MCNHTGLSLSLPAAAAALSCAMVSFRVPISVRALLVLHGALPACVLCGICMVLRAYGVGVRGWWHRGAEWSRLDSRAGLGVAYFLASVSARVVSVRVGRECADAAGAPNRRASHPADAERDATAHKSICALFLSPPRLHMHTCFRACRACVCVLACDSHGARGLCVRHMHTHTLTCTWACVV